MRRRYGRLLLFVPVVAFGAIIMMTLIFLSGPANGLLVVEAVPAGVTGPSQLHVAVTINGNSYQAPYNATLPQGSYTVGFPPVQWYTSPASKTVTVLGGRTAYAIGEYVPIPVVIGVSQGGFNVTHLAALHGVTPVTWANVDTGYVTIYVTGIGVIPLNPGQHYVTTFRSPGQYNFTIFDTSISGTVAVS